MKPPPPPPPPPPPSVAEEVVDVRGGDWAVAILAFTMSQKFTRIIL